MLSKSLLFSRGTASVFRQMARHKYLPRNLLKLNERSGLIHDTFPPESTQRLAAFLEDKPRTIYAGKFIYLFIYWARIKHAGKCYNQNPHSVLFSPQIE